MDEVTGIYGNDHKFSGLLKEALRHTAKKGVTAGIVGIVHPDGTLWFDWVGVPSQALGLISRQEYEVHKWLDENA